MTLMTSEERARAWLKREAEVEPYDGHAERLTGLLASVRADALREAAAVCRSMTLGRDPVYCADIQYAEDAILALLDVKP